MSLQLHGDLGASAVQPGSINADDLAATADGVAAPMRMLRIPAKATTSGTFVDFSPADGSGIPAWAKEVDVCFDGVSTNGVSFLQLQLGIAAGIAVTGYTSSAHNGPNAGASSSAGLLIDVYASAAGSRHGVVTLKNMAGSHWVSEGKLNAAANFVEYSAGGVTIEGVLDRIRLTTGNGTDVFDAGSVSIIVKG